MQVDASDDEDETDSLWLLGFVEKPSNQLCLLRHKFPSKVGGRPAWLNPIHLPAPTDLTSNTGRALDFLLQVYGPVDDNEAAFHRTMFVFVSQDGREIGRKGGVKAFRCQLPRKNEFYDFNPSKEKYPRTAEELKDRADPWKVLEVEASLAQGLSPPLPEGRQFFDEFRIVTDIEEAPLIPQASDRAVEQDTDSVQASDVSPDVEAAMASVTTPEQKQFAEFAARVSWDPEQVLRYCFKEGVQPLWPNLHPIPQEEDIPLCPHCCGKRQFEFQVMPQLLSSLGGDDEQDSALDWGTIAVYSCAASCETKEAYVEEFAWVQT